MDYKVGKVKVIKDCPDHEFRILTFKNKRKIVCHTVKPITQLMHYKHCTALSTFFPEKPYLVRMPYQNFFYPLRKNINTGKSTLSLAVSKYMLSSNSPFENKDEDLYPSFVPNFNYDFYTYEALCNRIKKVIDLTYFLESSLQLDDLPINLKIGVGNYFSHPAICVGYSKDSLQDLVNLNEVPKLALDYYRNIYSSIFNRDISSYHSSIINQKSENDISNFFGFNHNEYDPSKLSIESLKYREDLKTISMNHYLQLMALHENFL
jgi:hypothetical protein